MIDVHDKLTRSYNMNRIRSKNTTPEIIVRKFLFSRGFRFRIHQKSLPGNPDIVLHKYHTVIFVNGCFWHGHTNCRYFVIPKTRREYWLNKIEGNKKRDQLNNSLLRKKGWNVIEIFECDLRQKKQEQTFNRILNRLHKQNLN